MTISLTTPKQINAWVLLSRRSQLKMHEAGLKTPGIFKWIETNLPPEYLEGVKRTARDYRMALNDYIGDVDDTIPEDADVNFRLYLGVTGYPNMFADRGIFATMGEVAEYFNEYGIDAEGNPKPFVIHRTWDDPTH